ncbi:hypothetical protein GCM10027517_32560 [Phycicoccus ginsengisoli]
MQLLPTSSRAVGVLTLAVAAALLTPGSALAATTPSPTTTTTSAATATGTSSPTTAPTTATTAAPTTSGPTTTTPSATTSTTTAAGSPTTSPTGAGPTATTAPTTAPTTATGGRLVRGGDSTRYGLAAPAGPATSTDPTLVAAGFIDRELRAKGHHFALTFDGVDYPDYGVTLDAVLALDAAGAGQAEAAAATAYVADHLMDYISSTQYDPTGLYAGATGKTLLAAVAQGVDPRSFGGVDLIATLTSLETPSGRFSDKSAFGDNSNLIGQSFDVLALRRAGVAVSPASVDILRANQCADGGFRLQFDKAPCSSDPDVTAFAVQALIATSGTGDADAARGLDYLAGVQLANGGVGGTGPTAGANANTTGLAGQAFLAGGRTAQARSAQAFLRGLQYGCTAPVALRGGIAYDAASKAGATAVTDQDRRSTTQAILALAGTPLSAVSAAGAVANAPALSCTAGPTTSTGSPRPTTTTTAPAGSPASSGNAASGGAGSGGTAGPAPVAASATPGSLAFTGSDIVAMTALALVLLAAGGLAIGLARRKGAHA